VLNALEVCYGVSGEVEEAGLGRFRCVRSRLSVGGEGAEITQGGIGLVYCCYSFALGVIE